MEICVDTRDRVLVSWSGHGPYLALDRDGSVTEQYTPPGQPVWTDADDYDDQSEHYNAGHDDGYRAAVGDLSVTRPAMKPTTTVTTKEGAL